MMPLRPLAILTWGLSMGSHAEPISVHKHSDAEDLMERSRRVSGRGISGPPFFPDYESAVATLCVALN